MKYLKIKNNGVIDVNALSLMGASTKRGDDGQIGFFGTGNKYALSCFLRENIGVRIFAGGEEINITTEPTSMGDTTYDVVYINGKATSITTSMGPTWVVWQAIREVYSNAMDASGGEFSIVDGVSPEQDETHFYIELTGDVAAVSNHFDRYFSSGRESISSYGGVDIFSTGTGAVYRKGIRCIEMSTKSLYDYDIDSLSINEMRLAENQWQMGEKIWGAILNSGDSSIISTCISNSGSDDYLESALLGSFMVDLPRMLCEEVEDFARTTLLATQEMSEVMDEGEILKASFIHPKLLSHLIDVLGRENVYLPSNLSSAGEVNYLPVDMNARDARILNAAIDKMARTGISIDYPIIVARMSNSNVLALADIEGQRIVLAEKLFSQGETLIISALLEEWVHLKHSVKDCTRQMQDAIFNEFASVIVEASEAHEEQAA